MTNVGFFLQSSILGNTNCREIASGNPGIGGTEYEFILVASQLALRFGTEFNVVLFQTSEFDAPDSVNVVRVNDSPSSLYAAVAKKRCDVLVLDAKLDDAWYKPPEIALPKLIAWAHLFPNYRKMCFFSSNPAVSRVVCVGREELDLYRDHDVYAKATYVYNAYVCSRESIDCARNRPFDKRANIVTYIGSLTERKGFHVLADAWPEVLEKVPEAELHVIGSGRLYSRKACLGKFSLAEENYEKRILLKLTDSNGRIIPSVHFHGVMGLEKFTVLCNTKVGIPNPLINETFGLSALDIIVSGGRVVSKRSPGYIDTVGGIGYSYQSAYRLASSVCEALSCDDNPDYESDLRRIERCFGLDAVLPKWAEILHDIMSDSPVEHDRGIVNPFFRWKWLRELNRSLRRVFPFLPPVCRSEEYISVVRTYILRALKRKRGL